MKNILLIFLVLALSFSGCRENEEMAFRETGVVIDLAGTNHCSFIIALDNGEKIQPLGTPEGFEFVQGQRVLVDYVKLPNVIPACDLGIACDILNVEELNCGSPIADLNAQNYDSLANDPVQIHDIALNGDCLNIKFSFSGGCRNHQIDLARVHPENQVDPGMPVLEIRHDARGDMCEAWLTQEVQFDISPLKEEGATQFKVSARLIDGEIFSKIISIND